MSLTPQTGLVMRVVALALAILSVGATPATAQEEEPPSPEPDALARWGGTWAQEAELPIEPRFGASVGIELGGRLGVTIWGGTDSDGNLLNDGLELDSADPARSRAIEPAPISGRRDHGWAQRGGEVYVWGGVDQAGEPLADGAQFGTTWTLMPESPLPPGPASMTVVENLLWVVTTDPESGGAIVSSLRLPLEEGRDWSRPMAVPVPIGQRYDIVGCCDDYQRWLFVFSLDVDGVATAAAFDLEAKSWIEVGPVPVPPLPAAGPVEGHALEDDIAVWIGQAPDSETDQDATQAAGVILSRRQPEGPWVVTSTTIAPTGTMDDSLVLTPSHVVSLDAMRVLELVTGRWLRLRGRPGVDRSEDAGDPTAWWDRGKLWLLSGQDRDGDGEQGAALWSFSPKPPKGTFALPTIKRRSNEFKPCVVHGKEGKWNLTGNPDDPRLVWLQQGNQRANIAWPDGWHVRFDPKLVVTDSTGVIQYRGGQRCPAVTGTAG